MHVSLAVYPIQYLDYLPGSILSVYPRQYHYFPLGSILFLHPKQYLYPKQYSYSLFLAISHLLCPILYLGYFTCINLKSAPLLLLLITNSLLLLTYPFYPPFLDQLSLSLPIFLLLFPYLLYL